MSEVSSLPTLAMDNSEDSNSRSCLGCAGPAQGVAQGEPVYVNTGRQSEVRNE